MPKSTAALSMTASGTPSCAAYMASCRYGISTRLTRKPGALRHGQRQLVELAREGDRRLCDGRVGLRRLHDLDQRHLRHRD